jgi:xylulose-5-phosphate/fructose-6-phosphate phosphoketolase
LLKLEALKRSAYLQAGPVVEWCREMLARHQTYIREHFEHMPEVRDWKWSTP